MMPIAVSVKGGRQARIIIRNLKTNVQKGGEDISRESAKMASREYIKSAMFAGIKPWEGGGNKFYGMLGRQAAQPTRLGKYTYGVSIAATKRGDVNYFISLDRMEKHKVTLYKNRIITKWARDKGIVGRSIWVKPHPFIDKANKVIERKSERIANRKSSQGVNQSNR